jgi:CheY-like chemotaxis protein
MDPTRKRILVVDPEPDSAWDLCSGLAKAGHRVTDTVRAEYAMELIQTRVFDVAILDVLASRVGDIDLIQLLCTGGGNPLIVAIADFEALAVRKSIINRGAHHFLGKPVDMARLLALISPQPSFSGIIEGVDILEYLQFMLLTGKKTVVEVSSGEGECCRLFLDQGNMCHAVSGDKQGEEAFFQCVRFKEGRFTNLPWTKPVRNTITRPAGFLLVEAARIRDEDGGGRNQSQGR